MISVSWLTTINIIFSTEDNEQHIPIGNNPTINASSNKTKRKRKKIMLLTNEAL
jgi:hypothetical protein